MEQPSEGFADLKPLDTATRRPGVAKRGRPSKGDSRRAQIDKPRRLLMGSLQERILDNFTGAHPGIAAREGQSRRPARHSRRPM